MSAASGVALLIALGILHEGTLADRLAVVALVIFTVATASGWLQFLLPGRAAERGFRQVKTGTSRAWLFVTTAVVLMAGFAAQTWFRPGTTLAGGDDVVPNGTAWIGRLFDPWIWDGSTLGGASQLPAALPRAAILGLTHALGVDPGIAHRILETSLFIGAGLAALGLLASLRMGPIAAFAGATVYLFNPYVITWVPPHDVYLAAYCVLPAIPAALVAAGSGRLSVWWSAALVAASAPLIGYSFFNPPLVGAILAAMFSAPLMVAWVDGKDAALRSLRALLLAIPLLLATSAFWTIPAILHLSEAHLSPAGFLRDFNWIGGELRTTIRNAFWLNTRWLWVAPEYFPYANVYDTFPFSALRFVLPALAFSALALARIVRRDRHLGRDRQLRLAVAVATVALFLIFLSTGTKPPGNIIFDRLYNLPFGWLLQEPDRFIMVVALVSAILIAIVVEALLDEWSSAVARAQPLVLAALRVSIVPLAVATVIAVGFPLYTGALVPDSGRPLPVWATNARPQHVQEPAYWPQMAQFIDAMPVQGSVLVMPPDDFYEMPYTWYYGADSFIAELFNRHVLVPSSSPSQLTGAVNLAGQSILHRDWRQTEALVTALDAPLVLVRRDIVTPFPNHSILSPDDLAAALNAAPNFVLVKQIGLLDLYALRNAVAETDVGSSFIMTNSQTPDLRLLSVLPPNTAVVTGGSNGADPYAVEAPAFDQWQLRGDTLAWEPPVPSGSANQIAELESQTVIPLDRSGTFSSYNAQTVYSPSADSATAMLATPGARSAISNGDFSKGSWGPVGNCNSPSQVKPSLGAKVLTNGAPGGLPALQLSASVGIACVSRRLDWRGGSLLLNVMLHHVEGAAPRICLWESGPNRCALLPSIPDASKWLNYQASIIPDPGTTAMTIYLYADAPQIVNPTVSEYALVRVVEAPTLPSFTIGYSQVPSNNSVTISTTGRIAISNGDFTQGPWGPVSDCHAVAPTQVRAVALDASLLQNTAPGGFPALQLSASLDSACLSRALEWHGGSLLINMVVNHIQGAAPGFCLWESGPDRCVTLPALPDTKGWSAYSASVAPDPGTKALLLYLYADAYRSVGLTVNQYANVQVVELAAMPSFALLVDPAPGSVSAPSRQLVVVHDTFSSNWQGPTNSTHVLVDGLLNGWLMPAGTSSFSAYYRPANLFAAAQWASLGVFAMILLVALWKPTARWTGWIWALAGLREGFLNRGLVQQSAPEPSVLGTARLRPRVNIRPYLRLGVVGLPALLLIAALVMKPDVATYLWRLAGVHALFPRFADTHVITSAWDCARKGIDPLKTNPCDPFNRTMNYPRVWLLPGQLGLGDKFGLYLGVAMVAAFLVGVLLLLGPISPWQALYYALVMISFPVMLLIERGNNDLLVFALLVGVAAALALYGRAGPAVGALLVLLAMALKLYPIAAAHALVLRLRGWRQQLLAAAVVAVSGVYILAIRHDLPLIDAGTPKPTFVGYGVNVPIQQMLLDVDQLIQARTPHQFGLGEQSFVLLVLAAFALALARRLQRDRMDLETARGRFVGLLFSLGASVYVITFAIGNNWDYRLTFLLLVMPQLFEWVKSPRLFKEAAVVLATILVSLWLGEVTTYPVFQVDQLAFYALFVYFVAVLLITALDHVRSGGIAPFWAKVKF